MKNPFETIMEKLDGLENRLSEITTTTVQLPKEIIDRHELCKRLNLTEPTVIRWEKKGKIPGFRIGKSVRYNWQSVIDFMEDRKKGGNK